MSPFQKERSCTIKFGKIFVFEIFLFLFFYVQIFFRIVTGLPPPLEFGGGDSALGNRVGSLGASSGGEGAGYPVVRVRIGGTVVSAARSCLVFSQGVEIGINASFYLFPQNLNKSSAFLSVICDAVAGCAPVGGGEAG